MRGIVNDGNGSLVGSILRSARGRDMKRGGLERSMRTNAVN
jgi:hypothetical protein